MLTRSGKIVYNASVIRTIFIFDFDGTIADTRGYVVEISNRLSREFHYRTIAPHEVHALKNKSSREIIRHLKIPLLKLPAILARVKKELRKNIVQIRPFAGLKETLHDLKKRDIIIGILSSNARENILEFLEHHELNFFDFIQATPKVWSKNISLNKLIREHGFESDRIVYIGDEIRDIEAARRLGLKVAAVTWGYNSSSALQEHLPDFLIHSPQELFQVIS